MTYLELFFCRKATGWKTKQLILRGKFSRCPKFHARPESIKKEPHQDQPLAHCNHRCNNLQVIGRINPYQRSGIKKARHFIKVMMKKNSIRSRFSEFRYDVTFSHKRNIWYQQEQIRTSQATSLTLLVTVCITFTLYIWNFETNKQKDHRWIEIRRCFCSIYSKRTSKFAGYRPNFWKLSPGWDT